MTGEAPAEVRILAPGDERLLIEAVVLIERGPISLEQAAEHLRDPSLVAAAAAVYGRVVGFVYGYILRRFGRTSCIIYSVDVAEPFRRRGIGTAMLAKLRGEMAAGRWDEMFVLTGETNAAAMALYRKAGGVRTHTDDVMFDFG